MALNVTAAPPDMDTDYTKASIYLSGALVGLVAWAFIKGRGSNLPDGPKGLPLFGSLFSIGDTLLHLKLTEWSYKYGDFYCYMMGQAPMVVLNSHEAINDLFVKRGGKYSSRPKASNQANLITQNARIVAQPYGEQWRVRIFPLL